MALGVFCLVVLLCVALLFIYFNFNINAVPHLASEGLHKKFQ